MTFRFMKIWALLLCGFFTVATFAQTSNSSIKGTVQDAGGAVVSGATVTLTNVGTNQTLTTTSKANGFYVFTNLGPANYKVSATSQGFAQWVGVLTLRVSQDAQVDPQMTAASVSTKVTVRDVTPVIDRVNPTISDVKNATAIETLPVANRSILGILAFSPGVVAGNYGGSGAGNTRINGLPPGSVDYLVDGQSMTNKNTNELQSNAQSTMTFSEVKVVAAQGNAEYATPATVELVTKSGTNQFHGQIYELNQNNHLQARTFHSGPSIPFLQHNEYGFQVGGPIWVPKIYNGRNKTFFFADMEWIKQNANRVEQYYVPTLDERQGNLSTVLANTTGDAVTIYDPTTTAGPNYTRSAFGGSVIPTDRLNPVTQKIFGVTSVPGFVPLALPNVSGAQVWNGQPNLIPAASKLTVDNKLYTYKLDQLFGPNRLAARYSYTDAVSISPASYAPTEPNATIRGGHNGSLTFTEVLSPRAINVVHVGVQYNNNQTNGPIPLDNVAGKLGLPSYGVTSYWPQFYYNGYGASNDGYFTGLDRNNPQNYPDQLVTADDRFSFNAGNHQLMFGFKFDDSRQNTFETGQPGGNYYNDGFYTGQQDPTQPDGVSMANTGLGIADFLLGDMNAVIVSQYPVYHLRQRQFAGYGQDSWRATKRLTLQLGLRYEYWTSFSDSGGLTSTFNPNVAGGMVVYEGSGALPTGISPEVYAAFQTQGLPIESAAAAGYPSSLLSMPKYNFDPRVGFAYQLDDKTVLRGGYGIYRFVIPLTQFERATRHNAPFFYTATYQIGQVTSPGGAITVPNQAASELEFPNAQNQYGGAQPVNQFILGNQGCTNVPAGTCENGGLEINPENAAASINQGSGFNGAFLDPNYKPAVVQEYNLTLSRELPLHTGLQISFIGNHSTNLLTDDKINTLIPRLNCTTPDGTNCTRQERSQYPAFANGIDYYTYAGYANTDELQAQLTHTWGNGLTLQSYFTWMKALTTSEFGNFGNPPPGGGSHTATIVPAALTPGFDVNTIGSGAPLSERVRAVYSNDPTLPNKMFQLNGHYQLPFGRNQRYLGNANRLVNALVSGYNVSAFFQWHSGFYFSPYYSELSSGSVSGHNSDAINLAPGKTGILAPGQRKATRWFDSSVYDPTTAVPYAGQTYIYGTPLEGDYRNNIPANYMTGPGFNRLDANVYKITPIWNNLKLDFEAQVFNIYNHQNLGMPSTKGLITKTTSGPGANGDYPRTIQLQAKIIF